MKKIETLTKAQENKMLEVRDFWLDYIFSCKNQTNRESANIGIEWLYKLAGYEKPIIIYVDSPLSCQYAIAYLKEFIDKGLFSQVRSQVRSQVESQVRSQVRSQV